MAIRPWRCEGRRGASGRHRLAQGGGLKRACLWHIMPYVGDFASLAKGGLCRRCDCSDDDLALPVPLPPSVHPFKYSLFFGYPGNRLVGFDNERGKGDHWHGEGGEAIYVFTTVEQLIADFNAEVRAVGGPR